MGRAECDQRLNDLIDKPSKKDNHFHIPKYLAQLLRIIGPEKHIFLVSLSSF